MNKIKEFYSTKRTQKVVISIIAVMLVVCTATFAVFYKPNTAPTTNVSITLTSDTIKTKTDVEVEIILNGDAEVLKDGKLTETLSLTVNEPVTLKTPLKEGIYTVHMTSTPIESDGSTYKLPSKATEVTITEENTKDATTMNVEVPLERIAVADMTKEQLEVVIGKLNKEAPDENKDLVAVLKKQQETAKSDPKSAEEIEQESQAEETPDADTPKADTPKADTPKAGTSGGSSSNTGGSSSNNASSSGSSSGSSSSNPNTEHVHDWVANVVHHPATEAQGYYETIAAVTRTRYYYLFSDGCKLEATGNPDIDRNTLKNHDLSHGFLNNTTIAEEEIIKPEEQYWVETVPAHPAWDENASWDCACGAHMDK